MVGYITFLFLHGFAKEQIKYRNDAMRKGIQTMQVWEI